VTLYRQIAYPLAPVLLLAGLLVAFLTRG